MSFTLHGIGASSGIAIGRAHLASPSRVEVAHYVLPESQIDSELERFTAAVEQTREELRNLRSQIPAHAPAELPAFLDMHLLILDDNMIDEQPKRLIREQHCNAEWALTQQMEALVALRGNRGSLPALAPGRRGAGGAARHQDPGRPSFRQIPSRDREQFYSKLSDLELRLRGRELGMALGVGLYRIWLADLLAGRRDAAELLGITLLDHLILGEGYYSFADQGWPGG